jgi:membrane protein YqaA with SNARE-associated domain
MRHLVDAIEAFARAVGGPGLFLIAFLDSSFLSFPQVNDLLIIWTVLKRPHMMLLYATFATLGSIAGCLTLYVVARKGGEAMLTKRISARSMQRGIGVFQRFGLLAIMVPAILPPPAPFKIFVLLAGVARVPLGRFASAVAIGRGFRYFGIGLLTLWYGEAAIDFLKTHGRVLAFGIAVAVLLGAAGYWFWRTRLSGGEAPTSGAGPV